MEASYMTTLSGFYNNYARRVHPWENYRYPNSPAFGLLVTDKELAKFGNESNTEKILSVKDSWLQFDDCNGLTIGQDQARHAICWAASRETAIKNLQDFFDTTYDFKLLCSIDNIFGFKKMVGWRSKYHTVEFSILTGDCICHSLPDTCPSLADNLEASRDKSKRRWFDTPFLYSEPIKMPVKLQFK